MNHSSDLGDLVARARRVSAPLLAVTTQDPAATMERVMRALSEEPSPAPVVLWDAATGLQGGNDYGQRILAALGGAGTLSAADALCLLHRLPENGLAFFLNAHRWVDREDVAQAIWNLRDPFKGDGRTLVLLAPHFRLPAELSQDVLLAHEPLPGELDLSEIVASTYRNAGLPLPEREALSRCTHACRGLSAFAAEQALALSLRLSGMDLTALWERKRESVEQTPGLSFSMGGPGFTSIGGLIQAKKLGEGLFSGPLPPRCVVRIDEIEKQVAGAAGDLTGIAQDFNAVLLRAMQDHDWSGVLAVGPPGSGKSAFSKALGAEFQVPTLEVDLGAAKSSLVGESEANVRAMMKVILALAGPGGAFFIGAANSVSGLPPELRRRFRYGAYLFDLPSPEEREPIWEMYLRAFGFPSDTERPEDALWTGADVFTCCELAYRQRSSLVEASHQLLPVAKSAPDQVRRLREAADGRFLSASYPGPYRKPDDAITPAPPTGRRMELG